MDQTESPEKHHKENERLQSLDRNQPSLSSLIIWNISKALERDPHSDIRRAMRLASERLENRSHDVSDLISQDPEERYVACAVLAWQQLGHKDTESLYKFIESHRNKILRNASENSAKTDNIYSVNNSYASKRPKGFIDHQPSVDRSSVGSTSFDTYSLTGPVVKLPVDTKFVMRVENTSQCARHGAKKSLKSDIKNKVDACCLDSACMEKLKDMEKSTAELRSRATQLARREAERAELLERAEAAWRDLELGYQRRLLVAEEKEEDLAKQIKKSIEDRNAYKHACTVLAQQLGKRGEIVEKARVQLTQVEKEVCDLACTRLRLSEESAKGDAAVAEQQCKTVQLERDLEFKEEHARRKLLNIESVMDSSRGLTLEAERAMREELGTIKEQIAQISNQLLEEDDENNRLKVELDELRQQKTNMFEDLEGCKNMCDGRMQGIADDLNKKRQILKELKDKVVECQCRLPLDAAVEVKRTPSLAAMCRCTAEEHILHSCSCTSVRSTLLSNLLSDLFGGLQAELGDTGSLMPCQLLKCLEDKHNWDRASIVKSNLRSFFGQLLVGELDTAIATSIEKYHATWIGASCADKAKLTPEPDEAESEGWQERYLERRAQKLAGQLAEQLFQERADQLVERAKEIVASGPPPCECRPQSNKATAYPCLVKPLTIGNSGKKTESSYPTIMKRALQDVTLLRTQIEDLRKDTIKKEDLRIMEEKITKIVQRASGNEKTPVSPKNKNVEDQIIKQKSIHRSINTEDVKEINGNKSNFIKKNINGNSMKKNNKKVTEIGGRVFDNKFTGKIKKMEQSYAVNLCLFDERNKPDSKSQNFKCPDELNSWHDKLPQSVLSQIPSIKYSKPITKMLSKDNSIFKNRKKTAKSPCLSKCKCFHKTPSNTSINKLLETLLKWKGDLLNSSLFNMNDVPSFLSKSNNDCIKEIHHDSEFSNNKKSVNISENQERISQNILIESVKATETDQLQTLLTTSEYIGAINLDKSNEHICKCPKENKVKYGTDMNNDNLIFKCLNTSKCSCEKSNDIEKFKSAKDNNDTINSKDKDLNAVALTDIKTLQDKSSILEEKILKSEACKTLKAILSHKINQTSESNFHSNDRDLLVKFLGVTLTDINKSDSKIAKGGEKHDKNTYNTPILKNKEKDFYTKVTSFTKSNQRKQHSDNQCGEEITEFRSKTNQCQFLELYTSLKDNINQFRDNATESKNGKCLSEMLHDTKSCVCCKHDDETKNLEVNTFTLLEKHLKHKLADFKKSSGKSSSFLPDEEEKVFITILDKVKQVISNCTYNMKCECSVESNNSGSWTRFNNLLEEYLKIKIKRVRCTCVPNKESVETILPGVLEQVSNLIEDDFERLKHLCKLDKDFGHDKTNTEKNNEEIIADNSGSKPSQPDEEGGNIENVSIQATCNLGIVDKSCDAIHPKHTKDMQTSPNDILMETHSVEVIISRCCNLHNDLTFNNCVKETETNSDLISEKPINTTQLDLNTLNDNNKDLNKTTSRCSLRVPYVGYTLSSSCHNLNFCDCSKTLSHTYVKNIHNIWKMLEINKKLLPNMSYIMNSIPKTVRSENNTVNYIEVTDTSNIPVPESQAVKNVSASDGEEITLKDSDEKLKQNDINDHMTNTLDDLISVKTECLNDEDTLYWYDCCPSPRNTKNESANKKAFYDSIYSPIGKLTKPGKSDTSVKNNVTMCISKSKNCDCVMVPVCHVKMLVENIESKLLHSQCTCDSLSAQVCPIHSKTLFQ